MEEYRAIVEEKIRDLQRVMLKTQDETSTYPANAHDIFLATERLCLQLEILGMDITDAGALAAGPQ